MPSIRPLSALELQAAFDRVIDGPSDKEPKMEQSGPTFSALRTAEDPPSQRAANPALALAGVTTPLDIHRLMGLNDHDFVTAAYALILKRDPDDSGLQTYTEALAAGRSRILVLGDLRYSAEGRVKATPVPGLRRRVSMQKLYALPFAGRLLRVVTGIAALPGLLRDTARLSRDLGQLRTDTDRIQHRQHDDLTQLNHHLRTLSLRTDTTAQAAEREIARCAALAEQAGRATADRLDQFQRRMMELELFRRGIPEVEQFQRRITELEQFQCRIALEPWADPLAILAERMDSHLDMLARTSLQASQSSRLDALEHMAEAHAARVDRVAAALDPGDDGITPQLPLRDMVVEQRNLAAKALNSVDETRAALRDQERRLSRLLTELRTWMMKPAGNPEAVASLVAGMQDHLLDSLYVAFEDRFRGSRADIKQRQRVYLDLLKNADAGGPTRPILDVGSGRGELLELLGDEGLCASGVDLNETMVAICTEAGLDCAQDDAVDYLSRLAAGSLGAVTGFHIIEHLPFDAMVALFDASLHALAPGGIVIFETPNPANLMVASRWFYLDPTHRNPLPGEMVAMIAEARGFVDVSIRELHPMERRFEAKDTLLAAQLDGIFHGPQDYALIARKV